MLAKAPTPKEIFAGIICFPPVISCFPWCQVTDCDNLVSPSYTEGMKVASTVIAPLGLIRFGGHLMKGGYDGFHEGQWDEEAAGAA
jgi:hypothetical protein